MQPNPAEQAEDVRISGADLRQIRELLEILPSAPDLPAGRQIAAVLGRIHAAARPHWRMIGGTIDIPPDEQLRLIREANRPPAEIWIPDHYTRMIEGSRRLGRHFGLDFFAGTDVPEGEIWIREAGADFRRITVYTEADMLNAGLNIEQRPNPPWDALAGPGMIRHPTEHGDNDEEGN